MKKEKFEDIKMSDIYKELEGTNFKSGKLMPNDLFLKTLFVTGTQQELNRRFLNVIGLHFVILENRTRFGLFINTIKRAISDLFCGNRLTYRLDHYASNEGALMREEELVEEKSHHFDGMVKVFSNKRLNRYGFVVQQFKQTRQSNGTNSKNTPYKHRAGD